MSISERRSEPDAPSPPSRLWGIWCTVDGNGEWLTRNPGGTLAVYFSRREARGAIPRELSSWNDLEGVKAIPAIIGVAPPAKESP